MPLMISLKSIILFLRLLMFKYPISGLLGYFKLHLPKSAEAIVQRCYVKRVFLKPCSDERQNGFKLFKILLSIFN